MVSNININNNKINNINDNNNNNNNKNNIINDNNYNNNNNYNNDNYNNNDDNNNNNNDNNNYNNNNNNNNDDNNFYDKIAKDYKMKNISPHNYLHFDNETDEKVSPSAMLETLDPDSNYIDLRQMDDFPFFLKLPHQISEKNLKLNSSSIPTNSSKSGHDMSTSLPIHDMRTSLPNHDMSISPLSRTMSISPPGRRVSPTRTTYSRLQFLAENRKKYDKIDPLFRF